MIVQKLAGVEFQEDLQALSVGDDISIMKEEDNSHATPDEPAYAVMSDGKRIGYIPCITTKKNRMLKTRDKATAAKKAGDMSLYSTLAEKHQNLYEEVNQLVYVRDCIYVDIERNKLTPKGKIHTMAWMTKTGAWNDGGVGGLKSIVILLPDYI